jgi:hypothetical protein
MSAGSRRRSYRYAERPVHFRSQSFNRPSTHALRGCKYCTSAPTGVRESVQSDPDRLEATCRTAAVQGGGRAEVVCKGAPALAPPPPQTAKSARLPRPPFMALLFGAIGLLPKLQTDSRLITVAELDPC